MASPIHAPGCLRPCVALGQHLFENGLGVDLGRACGCLVVAAKQRTEFAVVVLLVFNDVIEDGDGALVAELLQLLAVVGDVAALFDLEPAQGHADAAGTVGQRVGFSAGACLYRRVRRSAEFHDAAMPEGGVFPLGAGQDGAAPGRARGRYRDRRGS